MNEPVQVATPDMWTYVDERRAATTGAERDAWESVAYALTCVGRIAEKLRLRREVAEGEIAWGQHNETAHARYVAEVAAVDDMWNQFPTLRG